MAPATSFVPSSPSRLALWHALESRLDAWTSMGALGLGVAGMLAAALVL